jgi:hypothetical protein
MMPRKPTKLSILYENRFLPNRELAMLLYGEVNEKTLARIRRLKYYLSTKKFLDADRSNALKPVTNPAPVHISFNDLKHYEPVSAFNHDSINDLNLRYLADVSRFVNAGTLKDSGFETLLFEYLRYYLNYFERNDKGNIKLYVDTNKGIIRGHHKNKALLYYLIIIILCKHYRCPNKEGREAIKEVIFSEYEDADDILNFYRSQFVDIIARELFL